MYRLSTSDPFPTLQGSLRFVSVERRKEFQNIVLHGSIHIPPIEVLSDRVAERMLKLNDGRMWMAGHMRRGDCKFGFCFVHLFIPLNSQRLSCLSHLSVARLGWAMENTVEKHFDRIKSRLHNGAAKLKEVHDTHGPYKTADIPFVEPDTTFIGLEPPRDDDKSVPILLYAHSTRLDSHADRNTPTFPDSTSPLTSGPPKVSSTFANMEVS